MKPEEQMLISAVRYALGRRSYIVSETCEFVASVSDKLSQSCIRIMVRDIEETIVQCRLLYKTCGNWCDEKEWLELLEMLKIKAV